MDWYIYYRVRSEHADALYARVAAMQQALNEECGIVTGLKRRPQEKDGRQTWMEIYQAVPEHFEAILERALVQAGLAPFIDGQRNTEYFVDISPCS